MSFDREKTLASAQKHLRKGNVDKAIRDYEKLLDEDPRDVRSKLKMADLLVKVDRFQDALQAYREVAFSYAKEDLYEKAAAVYKQAMRIAPEEPTLHTDLGEAYYRLGRLKDAVRVFHKAQKIYKRDNNIQAQRDILERMVRIDPEDVGLRIQLAERYEKDGLRDEAIDLFRGSAHQLKEEGRTDEFVQVLERIIFLEPNRIELRKEIVRHYLGRGDEKHALKHLQYCFKIAPQDIETLELLASTFHRLGSTEKALLVYGELAALYERLGEMDRAAGAYRTILAIDHRHPRARQFLGQTNQPQQTNPVPQSRHENVTEAQEDALDGIEFLDEDDSVVEVVEVDSTDPGVQGDQFMAFADDAIRGVEQEADFNSLDAYPEAGAVGDERTAAAEISESSLEFVEVAPDSLESDFSGEDEQIHQYLTESDVFLKYGLLDRAEDVITKVLQLEPDNLNGRDQMRKLLERMGDKRGAAHQLVEMARICSRQPEKAQQYLQHASTLVDDDTLRMLAEGAGLDSALYENEMAPDFISEVSEGLDEISSMTPDEPEVGAYEIDLDADYGDVEDLVGLSGESALSDATAPGEPEVIEDFSIDDFVDDIESMPDQVEEIGDDFALDGADVVDVDIDAVDFDETELAVLDQNNSAGENVEFDISAEDADAMFDELFGGGMFGDSDPDDVIDTPDFSRPANSDPFPTNSFGARSLSAKFAAPVTDPSLELPSDIADLNEINNSSLELGKTYKDMGLFAEAIEEFKSALDDPDAAPAALYNMALCQIELGETHHAQESLTALSQDQSYPHRWRLIAHEKLLEIGP